VLSEACSSKWAVTHRHGCACAKGRSGTGGQGEERVPEVVGAVFIRNEKDSDGGVGVRGVDAVGGGGVVFAGVEGEGFLEGLAAFRSLFLVSR